MTKQKNVKMLPKTTSEIMNGGVYLQQIRCGKANCRCSNGEKHIGYYFFTRINGKLHKIYIRKDQVEAFSNLAKQVFLRRKQSLTVTKISINLLKEFSLDLRERDSMLTSLKGDL
jgi:hypothetical protein